MNEKKIIKFNLYMTCILLVVMILLFVGTTIAYFFAQAQTSATLTSGNVEIALSEAAVKREGSNLVADDSKPRVFGGSGETVMTDYGKVYPGQYIHKDPTITNTGDNAEWIAAKITITDGAGDLNRVIGYPGYDDIDIEELLSGGLFDEETYFGVWNGIDDVTYNDNYAMIQVADATEGVYEFFFIIKEPLEVEESIVLFEKIEFPAEWTYNEMKELASLEIQIQAFGVQTTSLDDCLTAMTEAFPTYFDFN